MYTFAFEARDQHGQAVKSTIEAASKDDALRVLQRDGFTVIDIKIGPSPVDVEGIRISTAARAIKRDDVIALANQLSVMIETGVPLSDAMDAYIEQSRSDGMRRVLGVIHDRIRGGVNFSEALAEFPRVFPVLMISLMRASEASGTMGVMLGRIAEYLGKERRTVKQIRGALTYPAVMVVLAFTVTTFLVVGVLPRFAKIYESREAALPAPTRIVMGLSNFLTQHTLAIGAGLVAAIIVIILLKTTSRGRRIIDTLKIRAPIIGPMFTQFYLTRATRTLGTLLDSGVPLLDAVTIVRGVTTNVLWDDLWNKTEESLTRGQTLSDVVLESTLIPPSIAQMIAAGERTGRLSEVFARISSSTEEELEEAIRNGTQLIEPLMIMFMGVTIGGIAIALLLPIFTIANVMSH